MSLTQDEKNKILTLFSFFDLESLVSVEEDVDLVKIVVDVPPEDAGIYIGRFAATIDSLQLLLSIMLNQGDDHRHVLLDIGGYRARRYSTLQEMVERVCAEVIESGQARALPPLSSTERRQIHLMLKDHDTFSTYSEGEGQSRRLYISLKAE